MTAISETTMNDVLAPYGIRVDGDLRAKILSYMSLLDKWNRKVSLTTVEDPISVLRFHFGESFFAASELPILDGRLADVGTGAGFPGIPLKMIRPNLQVTLIESNLKKCAFLSEVVRNLDLAGIDVLRSRMEDLRHPAGTFDSITARAVGRAQGLLLFADRFLSSSGRVVLWLGNADASIVASTSANWAWSPPKRIPFSEKRVLLVGERLQL